MKLLGNILDEINLKLILVKPHYFLLILAYFLVYILYVSRDSSDGIALVYGLDDRGSMVRFPAGAGNVSLHHSVQNGSGAHLASYPMGTRSSFPGSEADHSPPSSAEV
jgi:hypothetical protein